MFLYVINVESCIHEENYRIFFFEPVARKKLELFEASWNVSSLTRAFVEIAQRIERRSFENSDYQVVLCVRRRENDRLKETSLYARTMVSQALEQSDVVSVITGAYTRKAVVLFQVEQPYYGTVPRTSLWEEEQKGQECLMELLQLDGMCSERTEELEKELGAALERPVQADSVMQRLQKKLYAAWVAEELSGEEGEEDIPQEIPPVLQEQNLQEEEEENHTGYIRHRLCSLMDGSGLNRCCEVIYWPVPCKAGREGRVGMLALADLLRSGHEITAQRVHSCFPEQNPGYESELLTRYRETIEGYRWQLSKKREQLLMEEQKEAAESQIDGRQETGNFVPQLPAAFFGRLERARQQLKSCEISLGGSRRKEIGERVEEIAQSLSEAFDGLEEELALYERETAEVIYRAAEGDGCVSRSLYEKTVQLQAPWKKIPDPFCICRQDKEEASARQMIDRWKQDTAFLTECAGLMGTVLPAACFAGSMAFAVIPFALVQGAAWNRKVSLLSSLAFFGFLAIFLIIGRCRMPRFFIRQIGRSYREMEQRLLSVLEAYEQRGTLFCREAQAWLEQEKELERLQAGWQDRMERRELAAMRAQHLAKMKKILDGLDTFQISEDFREEKSRNPEVERRILQSFDYRKNELENIVYWPVISEGREGETDG